MNRALAAAGVLVALALAAACADDAPPAAMAPRAATTVACGDCRTLGVGTDARLGSTSVGVRRCADGTCSLSLAAADGTETTLIVAAGDTLALDPPWLVVTADATGLVLRPG